MTALATALHEAMRGSDSALHVLDGGTWTRHPWPELAARAENAATRVLDDAAPAVGVVGEPTVELIAGVFGALFAGSAVSILPGPVRGADADHWAEATLDRFVGVGANTVFGHGNPLRLLQATESSVHLIDIGTVAHPTRSTPFAAPTGSAGVAVLQGTAGSTGSPRTARLSGDAVLANLRGLLTRIDVVPGETGCSWLPLYHDMGLTFLLTHALAGAELWQAPTSAFSASPLRWLHWMTQAGATVTAAPNMAYNIIGRYARRVSGVDLGALRFALNGGEPVDCAGAERFAAEMARFGFDASAFAPSYGLAESSCAVTVPVPGGGLRADEVPDGRGSVRRHAVLGEAVPGMQVRIDPNADGPVGEIEIRGSSMMTGYVGEQPLELESWFPTGDLGYFADGGLVVCGRVKEIITVAGRNVFPTEIEEAAARVPGVREGAVVAVGTGERSGRPAVVVTAEFRGPNESAARSLVVQTVAAECGVVPADVVFVAPGTLPRTSSGKLRRLEVKRKLEGVSS